MSPLMKALRSKYRTPQEVLRALSMDESLIDPQVGADVVVGDSHLKEKRMKSKPLSRRATLAKGALLGLTKPMLAADSKLNLDALLADVTDANWKQKKPALIHAIRPKLAADADVGALVQLLDAIDDDGEEGGMPDKMADKIDGAQAADDLEDGDGADPCEEILSMLRGKLSDEDLAAVEAKMREAMPKAAGAADEPAMPKAGMPPMGAMKPMEKPDDKMGGAMDAATVQTMIQKATAEARKQLIDAAAARETVRPYVGQVSVALDSAEAVFKAALDMLGVKVEAGVHPSAYRHILEAQPKQGSLPRARVAMDSTPSADFATRFPGLAAIKQL